MEEVQIVNGLQTSRVIFETMAELATNHPARDRHVLVRVVNTGDQSTRDKIIRATNSQTKVPQASLRATDDVQRQIEEYFRQNDWFYDRRKNYYRNIGKSPRKIVGIPLLAQAVMAMGLSRPNDARARPTSLVKREDDYQQIFSEDTPLAVFLWAAVSQRTVDDFLLSAAAGASAPERTNLRFHLSMLAAARLFGGPVKDPASLNALACAPTPIATADLPPVLAELRRYYGDWSREHLDDSPDKVAKGREFAEDILKRAFPSAL